jgi:uncharacterized protein with HEPN domain
MHIDSKLLNLFIQNLDEAYRSAKLIILSYPRVENFFPLTGEDLKNLDIDSLDKLDAFRVRFCDIQDAIGNKVFRSLLVMEMEYLGSNLDVLNQIEKRGIISSFEEWQDLRNIRNLFIHDYPDTFDFKAKTLTDAFNKASEFINVINRIIDYMHRNLKIQNKEYNKLEVIR